LCCLTVDRSSCHSGWLLGWHAQPTVHAMEFGSMHAYAQP
jgi:hypothetical protein